jgi:hypothetical protein
MRHGRKTRSLRVDGYKRHVLRDLDTELVRVVGLTPANLPEAEVAGHIQADLDAQGVDLGELHIDRAYLASALVRDRDPELAVYCKAFPVRGPGGRFAKPAFLLDFDQHTLTCPNNVTMPFTAGGKVQFPAEVCQACPLRERCTSSPRGRSVQIHPDERLLVELRARQQTPQGRAGLRQRVQVEHALAHVGRWQGDRARYLGQRKNLFDLRRVAVVHNLHVIAPPTHTSPTSRLNRLPDRLPRRTRRPPRNGHSDYCGRCRPCRRTPTFGSASSASRRAARAGRALLLPRPGQVRLLYLPRVGRATAAWRRVEEDPGDRRATPSAEPPTRPQRGVPACAGTRDRPVPARGP